MKMDSLSKKSKIYIVAGIAIFSLVIIICLIIWSNSTSCHFMRDQPTLDIYNMSQVESDDGSTLLDFEGYLSAAENNTSSKRIFLPLIVESVKVYPQERKQDVVITTNCAKIIFEVVQTYDKRKYEAQQISVEFTDQDGARKICSTVLSYVFWDKDKHYSCRKLKTYTCATTSPEGDLKEIARINLVLELEMNRDSKKAEHGKYSTPPSFCNDL